MRKQTRFLVGMLAVLVAVLVVTAGLVLAQGQEAPKPVVPAPEAAKSAPPATAKEAPVPAKPKAPEAAKAAAPGAAIKSKLE